MSATSRMQTFSVVLANPYVAELPHLHSCQWGSPHYAHPRSVQPLDR
jgi:hypothetical protein